MANSPARSVIEGEGSWTTNVVWKSFATEEWDNYERFRREEIRKHRTNPQAQYLPFVPSSFKMYIKHRLVILEDDIKDLKYRIAAKELRCAKNKGTSGVGPLLIFGGKDMEQAKKLFARANSSVGLFVEDIIGDEKLDLDPGFVAKGELLLGNELLKEL